MRKSFDPAGIPSADRIRGHPCDEGAEGFFNRVQMHQEMGLLSVYLPLPIAIGTGVFR